MARGRRISSTLLLLFLFCAGLLLSAVAKETYTVGGDKRWTNQNITATFYDEWAAKQKFEVDDDLLFLFQTEVHDVVVVTTTDADTCNSDNTPEKYKGNVNYTLYRAGEYAFLCSIVGHCQSGMKMKLTVGATAPGAGPGEAPSSSETPTQEPQGSTPPEATETSEPSSETTPPSPSGASILQSLPGHVVGDLFTCLAIAWMV